MYLTCNQCVGVIYINLSNISNIKQSYIFSKLEGKATTNNFLKQNVDVDDVEYFTALNRNKQLEHKFI